MKNTVKDLHLLRRLATAGGVSVLQYRLENIVCSTHRLVVIGRGSLSYQVKQLFPQAVCRREGYEELWMFV